MGIPPLVQALSFGDDPDSVQLQAGSTFTPARALEAIGDKWGLKIIRDALFNGATRVSEFEKNLGIPADIVIERLNGFVGSGLMVAAIESGPGVGNREQDDFTLTERGRNLESVVVALGAWSDSLSGDDHAAENELTGETLTPLLVEFFLLGSFSVRVDGRVIDGLSIGSQRLLVFLALHDRAIARSAMAGRMWPDASEENAGISLRSALSRLDPSTREAISSASAGLSLNATVSIDFRVAQALARRLTEPGREPAEDDLGPDAVAALSSELLPDWYDDWVVSEAEDWRQLRVGALEALAEILMSRSRLAEATVVARAAIKVDPLRETAHACLIRVHLAQGNQSEALRVYDRYTELLASVLELEPTAILTELVAGIQKLPAD
jgi:DNA-binding SARP family transcriptional activator/DNA-binding HxlR family transcriptional regulator